MVKRIPSDINLLFAVDKPLGCTSHDVVSRVRRALGVRRVGHAGTLDPLATGVMVLGVGQATRLLGMLTLDRKSYIASVSFGSETNTDDSEGEVTRTAPVDAKLKDEAYARGVLDSFVGPQMQVPPAFSAISVNGVRAYKRARAGENVDLPARPVEIFELQLLSVLVDGEQVVWNIACTVSKGTYIRSLARDIGRAAQSVAHIVSLRRSASGSISLAHAIELENVSADALRAHAIDPVSSLGLGRVDLPSEALARILNGQTIDAGSFGECLPEGSPCALVVEGQMRAIACLEQRRYVMRDVFPQGIEGVS